MAYPIFPFSNFIHDYHPQKEGIMRKTTLRQAIAGTLRTYRAMLKAAEKDNWKTAENIEWEAERKCIDKYFGCCCLFCARYYKSSGYSSSTVRYCSECPLFPYKWCQKEWFDMTRIYNGFITKEEGLRRLRTIVSTLEEMRTNNKVA